MTQEILVVSQTEVLVQQVGGETLVEQVTTQEVVTEARQGPPGPPGTGIAVRGRVADVASLPVSADPGAVYIVTAEDDHGFVWSGTEWVDIGPLGNDANLVHDQQTAADTWEITHNLGKYPAVTVIDSAGDQVEGDLRYLGLNTVRITFGAAFSGRAFFN